MPCADGDNADVRVEPTISGQQLLHQRVEEERLRLACGLEKLRQEQVTFDLKARGARLQIMVGFVSIPLLVVVLIVTTWILFNHASFSSSIVATPAGALFGDILTLLAMVWKIVLNPNFLRGLRPVTGQGENVPNRQSRRGKRIERLTDDKVSRD